MNIRAPVVEYREKESQIRHFHDPVADAVLDMVRFRIVAQSCLGKLNRTDAAENVVVNLVGSVEHLQSVGRLARDIVNCVDQDDIVIFSVIIRVDDPVIELVHKGVVLKFALPETEQEFLGAAFFFLFEGEFHIDKIFSYGSGKRFAENLKVFESLLL